jgi:predicted TIM-barrel fold metal-dependent hydrolase
MRCDSHVHIVGPAARYPQVASRTYLADVATLDDLKQRGATRGVTRFVIVQPSFYGSDNTVLLEALDALGTNGRGVAVIDPATTSPATLADCDRRGVRGLRLNLYSSASGDYARPPHETLAALTAVAETMRWHIEVIAPLATIANHAALLVDAPVPVVIDHYGVYGNAVPDSADAQRLLDLLRLPHVWIKLSAPYRVGADPLATRPDPAWLAAFLAVAPERCVWGSDWPHTPAHEEHQGPDVPGRYRPIPYERGVDDFLAAFPTAALAERILRDNPAQLYEF